MNTGEILIYQNSTENNPIKPIKNEAEYKEAFIKLRGVWGAKPNTLEGGRLELLLLVIEKYEEEHHPMPKLGPL